MFVVAFASATILPLQSEAMFSALMLARNQSLFWLLAVAGTGNTLGAVVNWWLGRKLETYRDRLTPENRAILAAVKAARVAPLPRRLGAVLNAGVYRQGSAEDLMFRAWLLLRPER